MIFCFCFCSTRRYCLPARLRKRFEIDAVDTDLGFSLYLYNWNLVTLKLRVQTLRLLNVSVLADCTCSKADGICFLLTLAAVRFNPPMLSKLRSTLVISTNKYYNKLFHILSSQLQAWGQHSALPTNTITSYDDVFMSSECRVDT